MIGFIGFLLGVLLIGLWLRHRSVRARKLSGTHVERPVFQVEPPRRRFTTAKDERL